MLCFNFRSFEFENYSTFLVKYKNLKDLFYDMTQRDYTKRPNCDEILKNKSFWSMNRDEYNSIETLENFPKPYSFVYHMIESKLNSNYEN